MKNAWKIISLILVLALFALMALGSGSSSDSSDSSGGKEETAASEPTTETTVEEKDDKTEAETEEPDEDNTSSGKEPAYEVGEGKVVLFHDSLDSIWIQISVPVTNTGGTDLYLSSGTMDLEDAEGHLVDSKSMVSVYPTIIQPGETAWYYEETTMDQAPESDLTVVPHVEVDEAKVKCVRYEISDVSLVDEEYGGIKVTGRVKNNTDEDGSLVYVVAALYDSNNEFIGQAFTILDNDLKAGDQIGFSASSFAPIDVFKSENVDHYDVYAFPTQFQF